MTISYKYLVLSGFFTGGDGLGMDNSNYPFFAIYELEPVFKFTGFHYLSEISLYSQFPKWHVQLNPAGDMLAIH
jgi:hypothetical protein